MSAVGVEASWSALAAPRTTRLPGRTLLLVADHQMVFAEALCARLSMESDLEVVGAVGRASHALALVPTHHVQVVLLGQWLGDLDGRELTLRLGELEAAPHVVLMGDTDSPTEVAAALGAGIRAWVGKESPVDVLLQAVRAVVRGETWLPPKMIGPVLKLLMSEDQHATGSILNVLTARELDVLRCMVEGLGQNAIAQRLFVSPNTVRTHRRRTLAKLGVHSSLEAVNAARRAGLLPELG